MQTFDQKLVWFMAAVGMTIGSYVPTLWGGSWVSFSSIFFSGVGGIIGIWLASKMNQ